MTHDSKAGLVLVDVHARIAGGGPEVLKGLSLSVPRGEIHAIMGPNGSGKSTLSKVIAGHPDYEVTSGDVLLEGRSLLGVAPEERARAGLFLSFQHPVEIPGVPTAEFMRASLNAIRKARGQDPLDGAAFLKLAREQLAIVKMSPELLKRPLNVGFSGGEKKRNEVFQMAMLEPICGVLDEPDSGLDVDALRIVGEGVAALRRADRTFLVITHYQRLLDHVVPDRVHVLVDGRIVGSGDASLALKVEASGYQWARDHFRVPESSGTRASA